MLNYDLIDIPSENFGTHSLGNGRGNLKPSLIIAHCIGTSFKRAIDLLTKPVEKGGGGVSAHYFIPQMTGHEIQKRFPEYLIGSKLSHPNQVPVIRLVKEEDRAWHAGPSHWGELNNLPGCRDSLNSCSIGIEFHAEGYANGDGSNWYVFEHFSPQQIETGCKLIRDIFDRSGMSSKDFIGHSDISPQRKTDPGLYFPWEEFAQQGFGRWWSPAKQFPDLQGHQVIRYVQEKLQQIGYDCPSSGTLDEATRRVISSFRMHFLKSSWKSLPGVEDDGLFNGHVDDQLLLLLAGFSDQAEQALEKTQKHGLNCVLA